MDVAGSTVYILSYTGLFCGVALIANYLSDQLLYQRNLEKELSSTLSKLASLEDLQQQMSEILPILKDVGHIDHDINTPLCVITLSLGRVKRYANEYQNEGLNKSNNEIMEAVNKISIILKRLQPMKQHPLLEYYNTSETRVKPENITDSFQEKPNSIKTPFSEAHPENSTSGTLAPPDNSPSKEVP